jgi:hypothetical protein
MKKIYTLIIIIASIIPRISLAAEMFFDMSKQDIYRNEDFLVQVFLDTKDKKVNAMEGSILFPADSMDLKDIIDGNSSVNFWIEKPHIVSSGKIGFSGITSGGIDGNRKLLFGMILRARGSGVHRISFEGAQVFENNGFGTKIDLQEKPFSLSVKDKDGINTDYIYTMDNNPPEEFSPMLGTDPSLFNGGKFLAFSTVDKGTGVDHYEVLENPWFYFRLWSSKYVKIESPYLIKDQSLSSTIYIKAIDKSGNERIVKFYDPSAFSWLRRSIIFGIILIICIIFFRKIKSRWFLVS